jgi:hypothetical protein
VPTSEEKRSQEENCTDEPKLKVTDDQASSSADNGEEGVEPGAGPGLEVWVLKVHLGP